MQNESQEFREILLHLILGGGLAGLHDVAVDFFDQILTTVSDKIGDVIFGDVQGKHHRHGVVTEVVEPVVRDACTLDQLFKAVGDNVRA